MEEEDDVDLTPLGHPGSDSRGAIEWFEALCPRKDHSAGEASSFSLSRSDRLPMLAVGLELPARLYPEFFDTAQPDVQDFRQRVLDNQLQLPIRHQAHVNDACWSWVLCKLLATRVPFRLRKKRVSWLHSGMDPAIQATEAALEQAALQTPVARPLKPSPIDQLAHKIKRFRSGKSSDEGPAMPPTMQAPSHLAPALIRLRFEDDLLGAVIEVWPDECGRYLQQVIARIPEVLAESVTLFELGPGKQDGFQWMVKQGLGLKGGTSDLARSLDAAVRVLMRPVVKNALDHLEDLLTRKADRDQLKRRQDLATSARKRQDAEDQFLLDSLGEVVTRLVDKSLWPQPVLDILHALNRAVDRHPSRSSVTPNELLCFKAQGLRFVMVEAFRPYFKAYEGSQWMARLFGWLDEACRFQIPSGKTTAKALDLQTLMDLQSSLPSGSDDRSIESVGLRAVRSALADLVVELTAPD